MKTNAIIRICIYSVLILFLTGILAFVLMGWNPFRGDDDFLEISSLTEPTMALEEVEATTPDGEVLREKEILPEGETRPDYESIPAEEHYNYVVNATMVNVRMAPTSQARANGRLEKGELVRIEEAVNADGVTWGRVTAPIIGWVRMEYVDKIETVPEATAAPEVISGTGLPDGDTLAGSALTKVNVRSTPSKQGTVLGQLNPGDKITLNAVQNFMDVEWGHITVPMEGWVCMNYVETQPENQEEADDIPTAAENGIPADKISKISIDWAAGDVTIRRGNTKDTIYVSEDAPAGAKPMVLNVSDGHKLDIQFADGRSLIGIGKNLKSKDLTVTVPRDFNLKDLDIDMAAGNVEIQGLTMDEIELDYADVNCTLTDCTVGTMEIDTASGNVTFSGSLQELDIDSASADFVGVFTNTPRRIDMDGMSGKLDLTLPQEGGFTAKVEGLSNNFHSDYPVNTVNGSYTYGTGACRINVDGMSGNVTIRKGK